MLKKILLLHVVFLMLIGVIGCADTPNTPEEPYIPDDPVIPIDPNKPDDPVIPGEVRKGTFNREYPDYYEVGVPLIESPHIVYINWDGFAKYYYDEFVKQAIDNEAPTLKKILSEGVSFTNLRTTVPSITNPCQNMILSGGTSAITHNIYRYYDFVNNVVVAQARENAALTLPEAALNKGYTVVSIHQYLAADMISNAGLPSRYIVADNTNPLVDARGSARNNDHFARMEQLIKLIKKEPIKNNSNIITINELPELILFYADDLDALGHNENAHYGYSKATTETQRMNNILTQVKEMDAKLGEFIAVCKEQGVYDKMTFFLTTDHGMTPFGREASAASNYDKSKLPDLFNALKKFRSSFEIEMLAAGAKPKDSTNVVAVGMNLNIQLTFRNKLSGSDQKKLKEALLQEVYIANVLTRQELTEMGYWNMGADMIITPASRYCFSANLTNTYKVRGQHDSFLDSSNVIYGCIWGKGIKENYVYEDQAFNYDFGITMAAALGLDLPQANGIVLDIFKRE